MSKLTNVSNLSLPLAVWLSEDLYDHDPGTISATKLIKSTKQIIMSGRIPKADRTIDISTLIKSRIGTDIHTGIEQAWLNNYQQSLKDLGYPQKVIDRVQINPKREDLTEGSIPVYMEIRTKKEVGNYTVGGKFDFVAEGRLRDFKSTSTFAYVNRTNDAKYILQGSIYRWLNPDIITKDNMAIDFIFTDWSQAKAKQEKGYPPTQVLAHPLPLKSIAETEAYVENKLNELEKYQDSPEADIPPCNDGDLWRGDDTYKYYKNPQKMSRSTKNFPSMQEAMKRKADDGDVGIIVKVGGEVKACNYCDAFTICEQAKKYVLSGEIKK